MCLVQCFHRAFDQDNVAIELVFNLDYASTSFPLLDSHLPLVSPMTVVQDSNPTSPIFSKCIQLHMLGFITHKTSFPSLPILKFIDDINILENIIHFGSMFLLQGFKVFPWYNVHKKES